MREAQISVHTEFALKLYQLGMPIIKLHAVGEDGACRCWKRSHCKNAGKHPAGNSVLSSLVQSQEGLLDHVAKGGNLGLGMYFPNKPKVPMNPLRIYAFDDDDGTGITWLAERNITSGWVVKGRKGYHVWAILPDETPDLVTKNHVFNKERAQESIAGAAFTLPKMDLRITGLMVLPMDNGKTLLIDGVQVTGANRQLMDRFDSLESIKASIPSIDPRKIIPGMRERQMLIPAEGALEELPIKGAIPGQEKTARRKKPVAAIFLSARKPLPGTFHAAYSDIPYYERERWARSHAGEVLPSIPKNDPWGKLVKVVNDCIHQYGMSDLTTWEIVRDAFNPRCKDADGHSYPWAKVDVAKTLKWAHEPGSYTTMSVLDGLADPAKVKLRLRRKGERANVRRHNRREMARWRRYYLLAHAMHELGYVVVCDESETVKPRLSLQDGSCTFKEVYADVAAVLGERGNCIPKEKAFGGWLRTMNLETYAGRIRKRCTKQATTNEAA